MIISGENPFYSLVMDSLDDCRASKESHLYKVPRDVLDHLIKPSLSPDHFPFLRVRVDPKVLLDRHVGSYLEGKVKLLCIYHVGRLHISITPTCLDNLFGILKELSENEGAPGRLFAAAILSTTKFENETWRHETGQALVNKHEWISLVMCMRQEPGSKCFEKCKCSLRTKKLKQLWIPLTARKLCFYATKPKQGG